MLDIVKREHFRVERAVVVNFDNRAAALSMAFVDALICKIIDAHSVRQSDALISQRKSVQMVVSHKHTLATSELYHFVEKFALDGLRVSEIIVLFTDESVMINYARVAAIKLLPRFPKLFWRDMEKRKRIYFFGFFAALRADNFNRVFIPFDLVVVNNIETAEKVQVR